MTMKPMLTRSKVKGFARIDSPTPSIVLPALLALAKAKDAAGAIAALDNIPRPLWGLVAKHAPYRRQIEPTVIATVRQLAGK